MRTFGLLKRWGYHKIGIGQPPGTDPDGQSARFLDIDRTKGFAIALVVWGHIPNASISAPTQWYYTSISAIYAFHMPLFMYLSGFVFFLVGAPERFWSAPFRQLLSRFDRLIVPFIFFMLLIVTGKYYASSISGETDPVISINDGLLKVITNTPDNPLLSIWYLLVLFVYTLVTPLLWRISNRKPYLLIVCAILGWIFVLPEVFYLKRISNYFIFFVIGGLFAVNRRVMLRVIQEFYAWFLLIFFVVLFLWHDSEYALLICGIPSIFALHGLFLQTFWQKDQFWLALGRYSMAIYLLNTIFIGVAVLFIAPVLPNSVPSFFLAVLILFLLGLLGPIAFAKILNSVPVLRPISRYFD